MHSVFHFKLRLVSLWKRSTWNWKRAVVLSIWHRIKREVDGYYEGSWFVFV